MPPQIATLVFALGIGGLFLLDRDRKARTSAALWLPVVWVWIAASRSVSGWLAVFGLGGAAPLSSAADMLLEGSPLDRNVYMGLLAAGVVVLVGRRQRVGTLLRRNGPILLFFSYCLLSVLWSDYPNVTFKHWTKAVGDLAMVLIVLTDSEPVAALKRFLARTGFVLLPLSLLFVKYYPDIGRAFDSFTGKPMLTGVTTGKNLLGMTCLVLGLGAAWRVLSDFGLGGGRRRAGQMIAQGALLGIALWFLLSVHSMTSLSCFLMASALIAITSFSKLGRKPAVVYLLTAAIVSVSSFPLFLNVGGGLLQSLGRDPTLTGRTAIWDLVLGMPVNRLCGTGFESFWLGPRLLHVWDVYWWHPNEAHNGYIEVLLTLGWIGIGLLVLLLTTGYRHAMAEFRRNPQTGSLKLAYCILGMVYNFTESAIRPLGPVWIFFLLAATAAPSALPSLETDRAKNLAAFEPPVDRVLEVG